MFSLLFSSFAPYLSSVPVAQAASYSTTWTTQSDFESNSAGTGGNIGATTTIRSANIDTTSSPGNVTLAANTPGTVSEDFSGTNGTDYHLNTTNSWTSASVDSGLVGYWPLDTGTFSGVSNGSTFTDMSGSGSTATVVGTLSSVSGQTKFGQALSFSASNEHLSVADSVLLDPPTFSLSLWINPSTTNNYQGLIFKGNTSPYSFAFAINDLGSGHYRLAYYTDANGWSYDTVNTLNYGSWTNVVFTYNGT